MLKVLPSKEKEVKEPNGIIKIRINPKTGLAANSQTPNSYFEFFRKEYAPKTKNITNQNTKKII